MNKESLQGVIKLIIAILCYYFIDNYFFFVLGKIGLNFSGDAYYIMNALKYALICFTSYLLYHGVINSSNHKMGKSKLINVVFSLGAFVLLVFINLLLHHVLDYLGHPVNYNFINYFNTTFTLNSALNLIIDVILKPFLLVVIFPIGFSNIIKNINSASLFSGIVYGFLYGLSLNTSFENAFFISLIPTFITILLTYMYKATYNIWIVYIAYALYICCGIYLIGVL